MGLGIKNDGIYTEYSIPLTSSIDKEWDDNSWICEHLRQLADKLEESNFDIYNIGIDLDHQYKSPHLTIKGWERKDEDIPKIQLDIMTNISLKDFKGYPTMVKWGVFDRLKDRKNIEWRCEKCGNLATPDKEKEFVKCKHCDQILTYRTKYPKYDPFNYIFSVKDE